jgi:hypothetical protein
MADQVLVTGIGSLPHRDVSCALDFVRDTAPHLPYWPQLPARGAREGMVLQGLGAASAFLEPLRGASRHQPRAGEHEAFWRAVDEDAGSLDDAAASAFEPFLERLGSGGFPEARGVKGQLTGPFTLARCLAGAESARGGRDPALAGLVRRAARMQIMRLRATGLPVLLVLDEPALSATQDKTALDRALAMIGPVLEEIRASGAEAGLHLCGKPPWAALRALRMDWLFFDAHRHLDDALRDPAFQGLASLGLGLGLVPAGGDPESVELTIGRTRALLGLLPRSPARLAVTSACGLALADPMTARSVMDRCRTLALALSQEA